MVVIINSVFNIGSEQAGRDIYNIVGNLNITQNSPPEDILKIIRAIQQKIGELDIDDKSKKVIKKNLENAKIELENKEQNKQSIGESIKNQ